MATENEALINDEEVQIHVEEIGTEVSAVDGDYGADQIQVLEGLEAV